MTWMYKGKPFAENDIPICEETGKEMFGFVYVITDNNQNPVKQYIGKKFFWTKSRKTKKNPRRKTIQSDWQKYYGSSPSLKKILTEYNYENFDREILHLCATRSECAYFETYEQFKNHVLLHPDKYYNEWLTAKIHRKHLQKRNLLLVEELK